MFTLSPLRKDIFTIVAKDNINFNATSSTATKDFHRTSMTVMQFPSHDNVGNENIISESTHLLAKQQDKTSKKLRKIPENYTTVRPFNIRKTPLFAPKIKVDISQYFDDGEFLAFEKSKDIEWLQKIANIENIISLSKYHSENSMSTSLPGINAVLLLQSQFIH